MREVIHALHQTAANSQRDKEDRARSQHEYVIAGGQIEIVGDDRAGQHQNQADADSKHPCASMQETVDAYFGWKVIIFSHELRAQ